MTENKPENKFRAGQISATIWSNEKESNGKKFDVKTIQIVKSYTTDDGKTWNDTNSFNVQDLAKLEVVVQKAKEYLLLSE